MGYSDVFKIFIYLHFLIQCSVLYTDIIIKDSLLNLNKDFSCSRPLKKPHLQ